MSANAKHSSLEYAERLVFFEQWLRFYFIVEENEKLYIRIPEPEFAKIKAQCPELAPMAEALNMREINHQAALEVLCDNMMKSPRPLSGEDWAKILAGPDFRLTLQLLSFWVQAEEEALDAQIMDFDDWQQRFKIWRESPNIKDYATRLLAGDDGKSTVVQ